MSGAQPFAGIDHVIWGVRDLERARMQWTRLGFDLSPRGRHFGWGTANYCAMFPEDYIELLGIVDPQQFTNRLDEFLARREGAMGIAFAVPLAVEAAAGLQSRGLHPGAPQALSRQLELPEGTVVPRFSLVHLPPEETPGLPSFVVEHLTPELLRRPAWLEHPNGATGILVLAVLVDRVAPFRAAYERLFGADLVVADDALTVQSGRHRIVFATPDRFRARHPALANLPAPPCIAAVALATRSLAQSADHLAQWQIAYEEGDGEIIVPPEEANGTALIFRESA